MYNKLPPCAPLSAALALVAFATAPAGVVINEFMANPSDRQLTRDAVTGQPRLGTGAAVYEAGYQDGAWLSGNLPAGYGVGSLNTNLAATMLGKTPGVYLRKAFTISAADAASTQPLSLLVEANDGFICWINGREVARANMGPAQHFVFADQPAYQPETRAGLQEYMIGGANMLLVTGENLIVIQAANGITPPTAANQTWTGQGATFSINAGLRFVGPTVNVTAKSLDFNNSTGASRTHTNNAGTQTNTGAGTNAAGGWLATMAANPASTATGTLTNVVTENATAGTGGGGGLKFDFTQTGAVTAWSHYGPTVAMTGAWAPGGVNANALAGTTLRFRYRTTGAAQMGLRLQPTSADATNILDGFAPIGAPPIPPADLTWPAAANATLTWSINGTGAGSGANAGTPAYGWFAYSNPDFRNGQWVVKEDAAIASPGGGPNGVLTLDWVTMPTRAAGTTNEWWGIGLQHGGLTATEWVGRSNLTATDLGSAKFSFRWKIAAGKRMNLRLEPYPGDSYNNRVDFGTFTGTGNWETTTRTLASGTNTAAYLTAMNASAAKNQQLAISNVDGIASYAVGNLLQLDDVNFWIESATSSTEAAPVTFASANNSYVQVACSGGTAVNTTVGAPPVTTYIWADPAGSGFTSRLHQDSSAAAGNGGTAGHLRYEITAAGTPNPGYQGFTIPGLAAQVWTPGALTTETAGLATLRLAVNIPAGTSVSFWAEPAPTGGYNNRADFGTLTGTGAWQTITREFSTAGNLAAFIASMNAQNTRSFGLQFSANTTTTGTKLRVDDIEVVSWQLYSVNLGAGNQPGSRFNNALNGASSVSLVSAFFKTADWAAGSSLTVDNFEISFTGSDPAQIRDIFAAGSAGGAWKYFVGRHEPAGGVADPGLVTGAFTPPVGEEADYSAPAAFTDWVELYNNGAGAVDVSNWALTDEPAAAPGKWRFPAGTSIPAGGYLIVMCDNREESNAPAGPAQRLHANFTLSDSGERVALSDSSLTPVDAVPLGVPAQIFSATWGRTPANASVWGFLTTGTPGAANAGSSSASRAAAPLFTQMDGLTPLPGGRFTAGPVLMLATTAGATIRYTLDGSTPTEANGTVYAVPIALTRPNGRTATVVRARSFAAGLLASGTKTETYLINQDAAIAAVPALMLTGDAGRTFYKPEGLLSIQGGGYGLNGTPADIWNPSGPDSYNIPVGIGQAHERETHLEWYFPTGYYENPLQQPLNMDLGLRVSSSPYSRPRLTMSNTAASPFDPYNPNEKCSWNLFFRGDFGVSELDYPLFPGYDVKKFQNLRLRAGKNDMSNPHISDELFRRTFGSMGHVAPRGLVCSAYFNGIYKGIYNLAERVREPMFQQHYRSENIWEVRYVAEWTDGLPAEVASQNVASWNNLNTVVNNTAAGDYWTVVNGVLDPDNWADYYLFNIYTAMWDWPWNNYVFYRERSAGPDGRFRCTTWDVEGACFVNTYYTDYVTNGVKNHTYNTIAQDLTGRDGNSDLSRVFARLRTNAEWRLRFADRANRALNNGGALDDRDPDGAGPLRSQMKTQLDSLAAEAGPLVQYNTGQALRTEWFDTWVAANGRRANILPVGTKGQGGYTPGHRRAPTGTYNTADTFWPETEPPVLAPFGGTVAAGSTVTMTGSVGNVPGGVTIYYTTDGRDPRAAGGAVGGTALTYAAPVALSQITTVKARARNVTTSEWSPLTEAIYLVDAVPATAANLVVAEIMYHPADASAAEVAAGFNNADDFEFIRLMAIGGAPVRLANVKFTLGITFDAGLGSVSAINPGQSVLVVRRRDAFEFRYGAAYNSMIAGEYTGGLSNGGEQLILVGPDGADAGTAADEVKNFTYGDAAPWPARADGDGPSLVLISPATNPDHSNAANWTATAWPGGLIVPGGVNVPWTYAQWRALLWGPTAAADNTISGPDADPDNDGYSNRLEYALGGNPKSADAPTLQPTAHVTSVGADQFLTVEYRVPANLPAGTITPQSSTDLSAWNAGLAFVSSVANPDGTVTVRSRALISFASGPRLYIRLLATLP